MSNSYFQFKQFTIQQDACAMKVGTDGVLLGAWCPVSPSDAVLDIGCGTGLIALMIAQRNAKTVDGVEIEPAAANQARQNTANSPWGDKINIIEADIRQFATTASHRYDLIVCNPPYFIGSLKNPDPNRTLARHADNLPFDELLEAVRLLLNPNGRFCLILPFEESKRLIDEAIRQQLFLTHTVVVNTIASSAKKRRVLLSFSLKPLDNAPVVEEQSIQSAAGCYSDWFQQLTTPYYLFL